MTPFGFWIAMLTLLFLGHGFFGWLKLTEFGKFSRMKFLNWSVEPGAIPDWLQQINPDIVDEWGLGFHVPSEHQFVEQYLESLALHWGVFREVVTPAVSGHVCELIKRCRAIEQYHGSALPASHSQLSRMNDVMPGHVFFLSCRWRGQFRICERDSPAFCALRGDT